jgi:hypothetical protein
MPGGDVAGAQELGDDAVAAEHAGVLEHDATILALKVLDQLNAGGGPRRPHDT